MADNKTAAFEQFTQFIDSFEPHSSELREAFEYAWDAGWKAAFESLGLTPKRLRELEAQYVAAVHTHTFDQGGHCDCGAYFEGNVLWLP